MSMKREELRQWFAEWLDDYYDGLYSEDDLTPEVAESVLSALRPVSREQVEKVWKSEWRWVGYDRWSDTYECSKCGKLSMNDYLFCPNCNSAMNDEAVDIVMKRLEEMKNV